MIDVSKLALLAVGLGVLNVVLLGVLGYAWSTVRLQRRALTRLDDDLARCETALIQAGGTVRRAAVEAE